MGTFDPLVLAVFLLVYLGMLLGGIPGLALDRVGVALLGALLLVASGKVAPTAAWQAVDVATLALLFGLMVVSAQFRLGGFYAWFTRWLAAANVSPAHLLAAVLVGAAVLSALLSNDIICLAMAPVLAQCCARRGLDPVPFLLGLACAANVGSAATLIGNPQNMLIGQQLNLSFGRYAAQAIPPTVLSLAATWWIIRWRVSGRWQREVAVSEPAAPPLRRWQSTKALLVLLLLVIGFLIAPMPREVLALAAAGLILISRQTASHHLLALVDWNLLILFTGLFIVHHAVAEAGMLDEAFAALRHSGIDPSRPAWLFTLSVVLSNLVSNVPATMLLLPAATHPLAGPILALSSTLAGNLIVVGSIANIIVVDQAARMNIRITWRDHARIGVPVTLATLLVAAVWLVVI